MIFKEHLPELPVVSIILPIRNEEAFIRPCVERLLEQDYPQSHTEILVIDGASSDRTCDIVREIINEHPNSRICLLQNPQRIVPPALNIGIRASIGQVVVRMDGHTVPDRDYISSCVKALKVSNAANAGGLIRPVGNNTFGRAVALAQSHPVGAGDAKFHFARKPQFVDTVYMGAYRKEIFAHAGLFDESMIRNQDYEMNVRIRAVGGKVYLDPAIRSTYFPRSSVKALWKQYFQYGWWRVETWRRHPSSIRWRQLLPGTFVAALGVLALASTMSTFAVILLLLQVAGYVFLLGGATVHVNADFQTDVRLYGLFPLALAVLHVSYGLGFLSNLLTGGRFPYYSGQPNVPKLTTYQESSIEDND